MAAAMPPFVSEISTTSPLSLPSSSSKNQRLGQAICTANVNDESHLSSSSSLASGGQGWSQLSAASTSNDPHSGHRNINVTRSPSHDQLQAQIRHDEIPSPDPSFDSHWDEREFQKMAADRNSKYSAMTRYDGDGDSCYRPSFDVSHADEDSRSLYGHARPSSIASSIWAGRGTLSDRLSTFSPSTTAGGMSASLNKKSRDPPPPLPTSSVAFQRFRKQTDGELISSDPSASSPVLARLTPDGTPYPPMPPVPDQPFSPSRTSRKTSLGAGGSRKNARSAQDAEAQEASDRTGRYNKTRRDSSDAASSALFDDSTQPDLPMSAFGPKLRKNEPAPWEMGDDSAETSEAFPPPSPNAVTPWTLLTRASMDEGHRTSSEGKRMLGIGFNMRRPSGESVRKQNPDCSREPLSPTRSRMLGSSRKGTPDSSSLRSQASSRVHEASQPSSSAMHASTSLLSTLSDEGFSTQGSSIQLSSVDRSLSSGSVSHHMSSGRARSKSNAAAGLLKGLTFGGDRKDRAVELSQNSNRLVRALKKREDKAESNSTKGISSVSFAHSNDADINCDASVPPATNVNRHLDSSFGKSTAPLSAQRFLPMVNADDCHSSATATYVRSASETSSGRALFSSKSATSDSTSTPLPDFAPANEQSTSSAAWSVKMQGSLPVQPSTSPAAAAGVVAPFASASSRANASGDMAHLTKSAALSTLRLSRSANNLRMPASPPQLQITGSSPQIAEWSSARRSPSDTSKGGERYKGMTRPSESAYSSLSATSVPASQSSLASNQASTNSAPLPPPGSHQGVSYKLISLREAQAQQKQRLKQTQRQQHSSTRSANATMHSFSQDSESMDSAIVSPTGSISGDRSFKSERAHTFDKEYGIKALKGKKSGLLRMFGKSSNKGENSHPTQTVSSSAAETSAAFDSVDQSGVDGSLAHGSDGLTSAAIPSVPALASLRPVSSIFTSLSPALLENNELEPLAERISLDSEGRSETSNLQRPDASTPMGCVASLPIQGTRPLQLSKQNSPKSRNASDNSSHAATARQRSLSSIDGVDSTGRSHPHTHLIVPSPQRGHSAQSDPNRLRIAEIERTLTGLVSELAVLRRNVRPQASGPSALNGLWNSTADPEKQSTAASSGHSTREEHRGLQSSTPSSSETSHGFLGRSMATLPCSHCGCTCSEERRTQATHEAEILKRLNGGGGLTPRGSGGASPLLLSSPGAPSLGGEAEGGVTGSGASAGSVMDRGRGIKKRTDDTGGFFASGRA